jgi:mono/diheme cytochrome c family protein
MALKRLGILNLAAVLVLGGAIVGLTSKAALAQEGSAAVMGERGNIVSGKSDFRQHCAQCHGMDATGDGPVAPALKKKPANLTMLAKNNGGVFPTDEVRNFIDGTKTAEGHGTREMPIWGYAFMHRPGSSGVPESEQAVQNKINRLVEYVKSIQVQ